MLYHITQKSFLPVIAKTGIYQPETYAAEGFIHCSTAEQVIRVANRFYANQQDLVLLEIDELKIPHKVVYENLEGGSELFPHIYGTLPQTAISRVGNLTCENMSFVFPSNWQDLKNFDNMVK